MLKAALLAFWLGQGADVATTHIALTRGCTEANPFLPRRIEGIAAVKGGLGLGVTFLTLRAHRKGHKKQALILLMAGAALGGGAAAWNMHIIPRC